MSVDVGKRLQAVRTLNGWSQRELAKRAGVTNSTISVIEQGRVSPSISSLQKVLDGIPMSLADFFTLDLEQSPQIFYTAAEMPNIGASGNVRYLLGSRKRQRQMTLTREVFPAEDGEAQVLPTSDHQSGRGELAGIVVTGALEVTVARESQVLQADEGFYFDAHRPHGFRNVGQVDCVVIMVRSPPTA